MKLRFEIQIYWNTVLKALKFPKHRKLISTPNNLGNMAERVTVGAWGGGGTMIMGLSIKSQLKGSFQSETSPNCVSGIKIYLGNETENL